jgi:hypothetical protein
MLFKVVLKTKPAIVAKCLLDTFLDELQFRIERLKKTS